jgi:hypothetical protein
MKKLERAIENAVVKYAKKFGIESIKLNGMGKRSLPDRMFLTVQRRVLFVEFKREGEKPTELQAHLHARWKKFYDHDVAVIDNVDAGKRLIYGWNATLHRTPQHPLEDRWEHRPNRVARRQSKKHSRKSGTRDATASSKTRSSRPATSAPR